MQQQEQNIEQIRTFVRIKPVQEAFQPVIWTTGVDTLKNKNEETFCFDRVFNESAYNDEVFKYTAKEVLQHSFKGYNSCILAYGQTSSGKTYTMKGTQSNPGIIPQSINRIFEKIKAENLGSIISVSYFQIYNENIFDLLNIREDTRKNIYISGLTNKQITTADEALQIFDQGEQKRKFGTNNKNAESSRSHVIFRINLAVTNDDLEKTEAQINMVDLAGSQGMVTGNSNPFLKKEGENINKSILALSNVIRTMSENHVNGIKGYINFRDSKLTRILQSSLCANSKSTIICTVTPTEQNYQQTMNTIKFGQHASKISIGSKRNRTVSGRNSQPRDKQLLSESNHHKHPSDKMEIDHENLSSTKQVLPTQLIELQRLKTQNQKIHENNEEILRQKDVLERQCMSLENKAETLNAELEAAKSENERLSQRYHNIYNQYEDQRKIYEAEFQNYKREAEHLYNLLQDKKEEIKILQKNEKNLVQKLQHVNNQIKDVKEQAREAYQGSGSQSRRNHGPVSKKATEQKKSSTGVEPRINPFIVPPYDPNHPQVLPPSKLSDIVQLKTLVIALTLENSTYIKANAELIEEIESLRENLEEYEENAAKRHSSKINPSSLEINEIRRLNKNNEKLKRQLNLIKKRQAKQRDLLKSRNHEKMERIEQFEEFMRKKYDDTGEFSRTVETQTDSECDAVLKVSQQHELERDKTHSKRDPERMETYQDCQTSVENHFDMNTSSKKNPPEDNESRRDRLQRSHQPTRSHLYEVPENPEIKFRQRASSNMSNLLHPDDRSSW